MLTHLSTIHACNKAGSISKADQAFLEARSYAKHLLYRCSILGHGKLDDSILAIFSLRSHAKIGRVVSHMFRRRVCTPLLETMRTMLRLPSSAAVNRSQSRDSLLVSTNDLGFTYTRHALETISFKHVHATLQNAIILCFKGNLGQRVAMCEGANGGARRGWLLQALRGPLFLFCIS